MSLEECQTKSFGMNLLHRAIFKFSSTKRLFKKALVETYAPHSYDGIVTIHVITNIYLKWMLLLVNSDYGTMKIETESFLSHSLSFKAYKMHITVIFMHLVSELYKYKNLRYWFKTTLTLLSAEKGKLNCDDREMKLTSALGGIQHAGAPETAVKSIIPCLYMRLDTSLYFVITNFYTELKLQEGQPWCEFTNTTCLINHGQLVIHVNIGLVPYAIALICTEVSLWFIYQALFGLYIRLSLVYISGSLWFIYQALFGLYIRLA